MAKDDTESLKKMAKLIVSGKSGSAWDAGWEVAGNLQNEQSRGSARKRLHRKFKKDEKSLLREAAEEAAGTEPASIGEVAYEAMRGVRMEWRPKKLAKLVGEYERRQQALHDTYRLLLGHGYPWDSDKLSPEAQTAIVMGILAPEDPDLSEPHENEGDSAETPKTESREDDSES